jgi:nucleotide-binding universal stress UspA family protein
MAFINRILVPTDFSAPSGNALRYALLLSEKTRAEVTALHIYNVPVMDPYMPGDTIELLLEEIKKEADRNMSELLAAQAHPRLKGECRLGFITDDTVSFSRESQADLIVMGTTGASGMKEIFFGSNTSGVIQQSGIKVLAVPESFVVRQPPSKICYASEYTENEDLQFLTFLEAAKAWGCSLNVLHIAGEPLTEAPPAKQMFLKLAEDAGFEKLSFDEIVSQDVTAAIETYVQATKADMLAMVLQQKTLFERMFGKSKTRHMAHHAQIPLMVARKQPAG